MGKNKQIFGSFADAASALSAAIGGKKATQTHSTKRNQGGAADFRSPAARGGPAVSREDVSDMEAAMIAKAKTGGAEAEKVSARRPMEVRQVGRGKRELIAPSRLTVEQVAADVAAHKRNEKLKEERAAREAAERAEKERLAAEQKAKQAAAAAAKAALAAKLKATRAALARHLHKPAPPPVAPTPPAAQPRALTKDDVLPAVRKVFAETPPPIEQRARSVQAVTRQPVEAAIARGAALFAKRPEPDHSGFIIGCDFGTSSVKIVVRQPYSASDPAARPTPSALQSTGHPYLWQTVVWFEPEAGRFSLLPAKGAVPLEGFKAGILAGEGGKRVVPELPVTRNEAAAAFLALQLSHCLGWYDAERPLGSQGGDHFLAINVGIPVAAQDDAKTYRDFSHVLGAARDLIGKADNLAHEQVRKAFQASSGLLPAGFDLVPELAAAIYGYANDDLARLGAHILIDVGASTLDTVAFILHQREGRKLVSAMAAEVDLLGAAAYEAAKQAGFTDQPFRSACIGLFDDVFNYARRSDVAPYDFDQTLRHGKMVQLIAVGGGCKTAVHKDMIERVHPCLGDLKILSPKPPISLSAGPCDTSRLLLAYGLTADIPEQLELRRPSDIPRIQPPESSSVAFISKDQM